MSFEEEVATSLVHGFRRHADFYVNTYQKWEEKDRARWRSLVIDHEQTFGLRRIDESAHLSLAEYLDAHPNAVPHVQRFLEVTKENDSLLVMSPDGKQETRGQAESRQASLLITRGLDKAEGPFLVALVLGVFNEIFPNDPARALRWAEVVGFPAELLSLHGEALSAGRENVENTEEAFRAERAPTPQPMPIADEVEGGEAREGVSAERPSNPRQVRGIEETIRGIAEGDWARGRYTLETRVFEPGDDRGFSTAEDASARLHASALLSPATAGASEVRTNRDRAGRGTLITGRDQAAGTIETRRIGDGTAAKGTGADYRLSLVVPKPGISGPQGMNTQAQISLLRQPSLLRVTMTLCGTGSSANEWALRDSAGQAVFLGGHMPGEAKDVAGKDKPGLEQPTGKLNMLLAVDQQGKFTSLLGADFKDGNGKVLAAETKLGIDEWNQKITKTLTPANMRSPERGLNDQEASAAKQRQAAEHAAGGMER